MDKLDLKSMDKVQGNIEWIREKFPDVVTEVIKDGKTQLAVDFDALKEELSSVVMDEKQERYQFTWPDKGKAKMLAAQRITSTLRPCVEESVDFDTTQNLYIEGDNLDVLKLLQEMYLGQVKMIYIDPPYNTGSDFVYEDNFSMSSDDYSEISGDYDDYGNRLTENPFSNGRFHTDWLNMIYPRLKVARDLLDKDGVIFISIDDNEQENLKKICNELFGAANFIGIFVINSTPNGRDYGHIAKTHEYALAYAKNIEHLTTNMLPDYSKKFTYKDNIGGFNIHPLYNSNEAFTNINRPNLFYPFYLYLDRKDDNGFYMIGLEKKSNSVEIYPPKSEKNGVQFVWRWGKEKSLKFMNQEIVGYKTNDGQYRIVQKMRHGEKLVRSLLADTKYSSRRGTSECEELLGGKIFSFPKPLALIEDFLRVGTKKNSIVLDFFSGSATTAHAVMQLNAEDGGNRKFIMVQLPELCEEKSEAYKAGYKNICEIGKERIRRAGKKIKDENGLTAQNLDIGFRVLKLDSSNMQDVYYNPSAMTQSLLDSTIDNVKPDRTPLDLLFQVMLDLGVELSAKIEEKTVNGKKYYKVNDNDLIACFDDNIDNDVITEIAKLTPLYAVFKDKSFATDSIGINNEQLFKTYSPATVIKVI